ncbi:MAG: alpha/beta fold hydrolase [Anaerolineae bacterium]|nr:alpha/beta fold hydrolase [Anaerolineae bacterium]
MLTWRRFLLALAAGLALFLTLGSLWNDWQRPLPLPRLVSAPTARPPAPLIEPAYPLPTEPPRTQDAYPPLNLPSTLPQSGLPPYLPPLTTPTTTPSATPSPAATATATASPLPPTPTQTTTLPAGPTPTRTLRAVTAAETAEPLFIESLRRKPSGAGDIQITGVWADQPTFTRSTMRYTSEGQRVTGYINVPKGAGPFPVIVMNHGYFLQERYTPGLGTLREADYLAERGYVVAVSDFRSYAGSDQGRDGGGHFGVDWVYDSMNLMDAVKRLPQVDPQRLGVWGHSTGGLNALQATVARQDIRATVVVSTMSADMTETLGFLRGWRPWVADEVVRKFGTPQARPDSWARMSPINYLAEASGPIQVHHGTDDEEVTPEFSAHLWRAMQAAGTPGEYYVYIGADHLWTQPGPWRDMLQRTAAFYDRYLK